MSVHGVGPSMDYNAGPQSQPPTTRTTPDSGLGGDERGMRPMPPAYYQPNPGQPMYNQQMVAGPPHENYPGADYKRYSNGTTYYMAENGQQQIPQEVYNRMNMARGQQPPAAMQQYQQEQDGYSHSSTPSQSSTTPAVMNGPPVQMTPSGPLLMNQNGQHIPAQHTAPGQYYYDASAMGPRPASNSYDGEATQQPGPQQQFVPPHPPQNFHQPPPNMYQHPAQFANGHPIQQAPHLYHQQQGYPHPHMVAPQLMNQPVYMVGPAYYRGPVRPHEQQQFINPGVVTSPYYTLPPPNIAQQMMPPQFYQHPHMLNYQTYRGGQMKKGGYARSSGRGMHFPIGRFNAAMAAAETVRPEMVPSEPPVSQDSGTEELTTSLTQLEIAPEPPVPPMTKDIQPSAQLLQTASQPEEKLEPEKLPPKESSPVEEPKEPTPHAPSPEVAPAEPEPPKPAAEPAPPNRVCQYCKSQNKAIEEYSNHVLKENQKVVCPDALQTMSCSYCGQIGGEDAHTIVSCPRKKRGEKAVSQTPREPSRESVRSSVHREEAPRQQERHRSSYQRGEYGGGYREGGYQQREGGYHQREGGYRDGYSKNYRGSRGQSRGGYVGKGGPRSYNQTSRQQSQN